MDDGRVNGHIILFVVLFLSWSRQIITPCGHGVDTGQTRIYIYIVKLMRNESVVEARDPLEKQVRRATVTAAAAE